MKTPILALTGALLLALLLLQPAPARAELGHYDATAALTLTSTTPGAARGETFIASVPSGNLLDAGLDPFSAGPGPFIFEPTQVTITPGCNRAGFRDFNNDNVVDAGETPCLAQGAAAGTHTWQATLGLSNGPCSTAATITVDLFNIAMPDNELDPRASSNIVFPKAQGTADRFGGWAVGAPPGGAGTAPLDANGDGRAEAGSLAVQNYPSYLLDLADPDGAGLINPVLPVAVYGGLSKINGEWMPFYFVQYRSGDLPTAFSGKVPNPYAGMVASVGHPLHAVSGDPTATVASPTSITDVCSPSTATTTFNDTVGGVTRAANSSSAGTYLTLAWRASQRDLDNDRFENNIDSCPMIANVEDPRATSGADGDMLDSACDPSPGTGNSDADADGVVNALDNCPLIANASQVDGELAYPPAWAVPAFDGGPMADHIGTGCDTGSITITQNNKTTTITSSSTVANGHFHVDARVLAHCYGGIDGDGDGYCTTQDNADSGSCASTTPVSCRVRHSAWTTTAAFAHLLELDTDRAGGDTTTASDGSGSAVPCSVRPSCMPTIACPGGLTDVCPEKGFDSDFLETYVGSNPAQACAQDTTVNNEPYDSWAYDKVDDTRSSLSDVTSIGPVFGKFINANVAYGTAITLAADQDPGTGGDQDATTTQAILYYSSTGDPAVVGDIINIDNESMKVWAVDTAANTVSVIRGWWGSLGTTHAAGATINKAAGSRHDINGDGLMSLSDVTAYGPFFGKQCRRVDGTFGAPQ
jgi:hypothetical protein